ncbi:MAG: ribosome maturation factor RimP [Nitrospirota bacterium]
MSDVVEDIRRLLDPILGSLGLSLWDIEFKKEGPRRILRVTIDRESGVSLGDCEAVSRDLGAALDVEDAVSSSYTLEVSSPGLDRTLFKPEHFVRFAGKMIRIKTYQSIDGQKVFRGRLLGAGETTVRLEPEKGGVLEIPFQEISKASLEVEL